MHVGSRKGSKMVMKTYAEQLGEFNKERVTAKALHSTATRLFSPAAANELICKKCGGPIVGKVDGAMACKSYGSVGTGVPVGTQKKGE